MSTNFRGMYPPMDRLDLHIYAKIINTDVTATLKIIALQGELSPRLRTTDIHNTTYLRILSTDTKSVIKSFCVCLLKISHFRRCPVIVYNPKQFMSCLEYVNICILYIINIINVKRTLPPCSLSLFYIGTNEIENLYTVV